VQAEKLEAREAKLGWPLTKQEHLRLNEAVEETSSNGETLVIEEENDLLGTSPDSILTSKA
jgi:hypothetical protein